MDNSNPRTKRVKVLTDSQREAIRSMQSANEIPHAERKRQWNALHRKLKQPDLPEGLLEKWNSSKTAASKSLAQLSFESYLNALESKHFLKVQLYIYIYQSLYPAQVRISQVLLDGSVYVVDAH